MSLYVFSALKSRHRIFLWKNYLYLWHNMKTSFAPENIRVSENYIAIVLTGFFHLNWQFIKMKYDSSTWTISQQLWWKIVDGDDIDWFFIQW